MNGTYMYITGIHIKSNRRVDNKIRLRHIQYNSRVSITHTAAGELPPGVNISVFQLSESSPSNRSCCVIMYINYITDSQYIYIIHIVCTSICTAVCTIICTAVRVMEKNVLKW